MKKILLWLWQLPQNILGVLVIIFTGAVYNNISDLNDENFWITRKFRFGVSLGNYIIIGAPRYSSISVNTIKHEHGHQVQSMYLGPLYLLIIGLPSITGNILNRFIRFNYYKQPWEAWADKLGGVVR